MHKQFGWWWVVAVVVCGAWSAPVRACQVCTSEMWCTDAQRGGGLCLGTGDWCAMAGKCTGGAGGRLNEYAMVQLTLLEDVPGAAAPLARVQRGVGALSVGRHAQGALRGSGVSRVPDAPVLFSGVGVFEGGPAAIRSARGDGFVLSRSREGRGTRIRVRELQGDRPGRTLAEERLDDRDALVVRVTLDGRPRVLVLQAATLAPAEARSREEECRRVIGETPSARLPGEPPPFELRAIPE